MATLKDIAEYAGVSVSTVSRALNGPTKEDERARGKQTRRMIRRIAKDLSYHPNALGRALSTQRTFNIGIMWDKRMDSPEESVFWSPVLRGVITGCKAAGYHCMVSIEDYRTNHGFELPRNIREQYVDGVVVTYPLGDINKEVQQKLVDLGISFVVIWKPFVDPNVWSVDVDLKSGYRQALLHLVELGHRKIAFGVYPHGQLGECQTSKEIEEEMFNEFGIRLTPLVVDLSRNTHREEGIKVANKILNGELDITAMMMGDLISTEAIAHLARHNVRVPQDFSVVGLSNSFVCEYCNPSLTSMVQPLFEVGQKAVALLADNIRGKNIGANLAPRRVMLPMGFVVRESTGPVPDRKVCSKTNS